MKTLTPGEKFNDAVMVFRMYCDLAGLSFDLDSDMNFKLADVSWSFTTAESRGILSPEANRSSGLRLIPSDGMLRPAKGQWSFGIQASYGEFNTEDFQILSILKNLDLKVKAYSLEPSISYFFGNNQSIG